MTIQYDKGSGVPDLDGNKYWCLNGILHRINGPSIEYLNGTKIWHLNGLRHRLDGPACEWSNGDNWWYLNDKAAIKVWNKDIIVGGKIEIKNDVGIVLKQTDTNIYLVLLGNNKIFIRE